MITFSGLYDVTNGYAPRGLKGALKVEVKVVDQPLFLNLVLKRKKNLFREGVVIGAISL